MNEFKKKTLELKDILNHVLGECQKKKIDIESDQIAVVKDLSKEYYPILNERIQELSILAKCIENDEYDKYKTFFRINICPYLVNDFSSLNKHICSKPLGYAGDYIVANHFYEDGFPGANISGKFVDRFTIESPLARAHINRRKHIGDLIKMLCKRNSDKNISVASFACGPAQEVFDVLDANVTNVNFTLIDGEKQVECFINKKLSLCNKNNVNIRFYHHNILNLVRKNEVLEIENQDLIYCAGFFDYLHDKTCTRLIKYMFKFLKNNGQLLIVNVSLHDRDNIYLKMIGEWNLHHRSLSNMLSLVPKDIEICHKKVFSDPLNGRNLYLIIKRS